MFNWPFKLLIVFIFLCLIVWSIISYFFSSDPLKNSSLSLLLEQGLHFSVLSEDNTILYNKVINPLDVVLIKDVPSVLKNAVLASIFILNDNKPNCSPNLSVNKQAINNCNFVYSDVLTKEYILNNIIQSNLTKGDNSPDLYYKLRYYLAIRWLEKNFNTDKFINFLLNYSHYGEGILGLKEASKSFLDKDLTQDNITPSEAALLVNKLFHNSYYIYKYTDIKDKLSKINIKSILSAMSDLGYIDKTYELTTNSNEKIAENISIYQIFNEKIFNMGMPLTTTTNNIYIYTTLYKGLHEAINENLLEAAKKYNLGNVAAYVIKDNKVITGMNICLKNDKIFYENKLPTIKAQNLLKPLLYAELFNNNIHIPKVLMNANIQHLINIKKFASSELTKIFPSFASKDSLNIDNINNGDNEINSLYQLISELVILENELFSKLENKSITSLMQDFHLPEKSLVKQKNQITLTATLDNIVNSFAILNQQGKYYVPIYIKKVNNQPLNNTKEMINTHLNINSINETMNLINEESYHHSKYKVIFDSNMVLIYYNKYTLGIYISNPPSNENKYYILKDLANSTIEFITQDVKE